MSADSVVQLVIATLCALLAVLHVALWRLARRDRLQLWLASALTGGALFGVSLAARDDALGWSVPWLAVGVVGNLPGWIGYMMTIWTFAGLPLTWTRRCVLAAIGVLWSISAVVHAVFLARHTAASPSWDAMTRGEPWLGMLIGIVLCATPLVEGIRLMRRRRRHAIALLVAAGASIAIVVAQFGLGGLGVTLIGLTGLPVVLIASTAVLFRFREALERAGRAGDYELVRRLGAGGMGELYLATRLGPAGFRRAVALKRIRARGDEQTATERLLTEARTAAALAHPNIVAVHDVGKLDDFGWYIAMELLSGIDLAKLRSAGSIPIELAVAIGEQVARGIAYANAQGVLHRDISPQNVVVTFTGEVKVVDFGIAIDAGRGGDGKLAGKPPYLAPEILQGDPSSAASDQFALGVVLYELLAGVRPFRGRNALELVTAMRRRLQPLSELRRDVPGAVAVIIERALATAPAERFPDCGSLADALAAAARTLPAIDVAAFVRGTFPDARAEQEQLATLVDTPATQRLRAT